MNDETLCMFDLFNIEFQEETLDIFNNIRDYCYKKNITFDERSYGIFFRIIFDNINIYESSEFLKHKENLEISEMYLENESDNIEGMHYDDYF